MKKALSIFLTAAIIMNGIGIAAGDTPPLMQSSMSNFEKTRTYDNTFSDIDGHWAKEYITSAYEYGIINGIEGNLYNPLGYMTTAEAITIAARLHMSYKYSDNGQNIPDSSAADVTSEHWAAKYIAYALNERLISDEWESALDKPVTRAEIVKIWSNILQAKDMASINTVNALPDVTLSTPYFAEITIFYEAGIIQGSTINGVQNCFNPSGTISRAEAATVFMMLTESGKRISGRTYGAKTVQGLAGTGTSGFISGVASISSFTLPYGLAVNKNGGIIIFDTYNNALRSFNRDRVETLAGKRLSDDDNGFSRGFHKDGSLSDALFNRPTGGVYSPNGDLYVCDSENHVIRLIKGGTAYTFAGGEAGYANGSASSAKFNTPTDIATDKNGNLYIADTMNNCIRKIDAKGNVTTIAGVAGKSGNTNGATSSSLFYNPSGIAVSGDGSVIYVADTGNHCIRKIENGNVTTLTGVTTETDEDGDPVGGFSDGAASEAVFNLPKGLTLADNVLFVADSGNNAIRAVTMNGNVYTAAGTGAPGDREGGSLTAGFNQPAGVLWHSGILYIADTGNNMIKTLTVDTTIFKETR